MLFSNFMIFSFAVFLSVVAAIGLQYSFFNVSFDHVPMITYISFVLIVFVVRRCRSPVLIVKNQIDSLKNIFFFTSHKFQCNKRNIYNIKQKEDFKFMLTS